MILSNKDSLSLDPVTGRGSAGEKDCSKRLSPYLMLAIVRFKRDLEEINEIVKFEKIINIRSIKQPRPTGPMRSNRHAESLRTVVEQQ